tara:strand:- start:1132 stop:1374 length:243 start_codon:yes stop_codon:yes gene_type:complete
MSEYKISKAKLGSLFNILVYSRQPALRNVYRTKERNCLLLEVIKDNYFDKGLIVYLHDGKKKIIDLSDDVYDRYKFELQR